MFRIDQRKYLSQNFIKDTGFAKSLVNHTKVNINPGDHIVEIGPGTGKLTIHLLKKLKNVSCLKAIEFDKSYFNLVKSRFKENQKFEVVNEDILNFLSSNNLSNNKVFSNLPFSITSSTLNLLLDFKTGPTEIYLILQKEAALMFGGKSIGAEKETMKSLLAYPLFDFEVLQSISSNEFKPEPKVEIVFIKIKKKVHPLISKNQIEKYQSFTKDISKDRFGQGIWKKYFTSKELSFIQKEFGLVWHKGIGIQDPKSIIRCFEFVLWKSERKG